MYKSLSSLVLGFHGCDKSVYDKIICGQDTLKPSENDYDWLGNGIYFWENNPKRALEYAKLIKNNPHRSKNKINNEAIIGAVIDLGYCLNLLESDSLKLVKEAYNLLKETFKTINKDLPENKSIFKEKDILIKKLDCAVIETLHEFNRSKGNKEFDSVRGVFWEGDDLYPNAGFKEKNHIQICIRNPNCIKGYFSLLKENPKFPTP